MAHDCAIAREASGAEPNAVYNVTVMWYVDILGFTEFTARALYTGRMRTGKDVLVDLTNKSVNDVCAAIQKLGGASQGDPTPVLAIDRLKLTVFCIKLYEQTSQNILDMTTLTINDIISVRDQKREEDEYLSSKDLKPELKPMSIDVHSAPTCFDKARVILGNMWGCIGIPLTYVIRLNSLTPICVRAGIKNYRSVEFLLIST